MTTASEQRIVVTVHTLAGGDEYAVPVRLGATLTTEAELRRRREFALAHGWAQVAVRIEEEICYAQRGYPR